MTSLAYSELELLIYLHFPMAATGIIRGVCHFDVAKWYFASLSWEN